MEMRNKILRARSEFMEIYKDMNEASKTIEATCISVRKSGSRTSCERVLEDGISLWRNTNHVDKPESSRSGHRTKSMSAQLMIDLDELINSASGRSSKESDGMLSRALSARLGFSFSPAGATMPLDDTSDVLRTKSNTDGGIESSMVDEDLESGSQKKIKPEPTLPIFLKFSNVKYKVVAKGEKTTDAEKYILQGVTGSVHPGEVLALMGPSGGGKTTLLNLLSGRVKNNVPGGSITYNNQPYSKSLKRRIGFVLQDDVVFPHLTVKEILTYSALLRLPSKLTKQQKEERTMDIITELGLERCQDTVIGGAFVRGISGGERKRVCIGNEIILNPSLLFLDEPTSGLDSTTADRIVQMLYGIAKAGKTVITTIHQPSSRLFQKFDKLILLGKGSLLYFGQASEAMLYFSSIGCSPLIAMNPAEFLIDLANGNIYDKSIPSELEDKGEGKSQGNKLLGRPSPIDVHEYLVEAYETRVANIEKRKLLKPMAIEDDWEMQGESGSKECGASWWEQYCILFWRGLKERRHDYLSCIRVAQVLSTAVVLGLLWWNSSVSSPKKLQDQAGLLFFISVFWGFLPVLMAIFTFPLERAMLTKERSVDMYKLSAYFMARTTSDLPLDLILLVLFLVIVYFMGGLKPSTLAFSLTMLTIFLSIAAAQGLGLAIGASVMDTKKATTLASVVVMTFMLTGGFFVQRVPSFISWIRYISFNYHTYRLLLEIQYNCVGSVTGSGLCGFPFIKEHKLDGGGKEVGFLIAMVFGYRFLAYLSLRRMKLATAT